MCVCVCACCCLSCVLLDTFSHFSDILPSPSNSVGRLRFWFWAHSSQAGDFKQPQNRKKSGTILAQLEYCYSRKHIFTFMRCISTYTFPILYFSAGVAVKNETDFCRTYCEELFYCNFEFRSVFLDSAALLSGNISVPSVCLFVCKKMLHHSCLVTPNPGIYTNARSTTITARVIIRIP